MNKPGRIDVLAIALAAIVPLSLSLAGCKSDQSGTVPKDGGNGDDNGNKDGGDAKSDPKPTCSDASLGRSKGQGCACDIECASGHCTDGVCCESACTDKCKACNVPGLMGSCSVAPPGTRPRDPGTCPETPAASCGLDGTCDGAGACRKYPAGTQCKAGACMGSSVTGAQVCDGKGACAPGPAIVCTPYGCDASTGMCFGKCTKDTECAGKPCMAGSCGKKNPGASCGKNEECVSNFCVDGVCCNTACAGACKSCKSVGKVGFCWPTETGVADPRGMCKDDGVTSCGGTGACDGSGACAKYPAGASCKPPSCAGTTSTAGGSCDGSGACTPGGSVDCAPYVCGGAACKSSCASDADCVSGVPCIGGSCGKKGMGQSCKDAAECGSGFCVDGVCCQSACTGACRRCNVDTLPGHCVLMPPGVSDPRALCADMGPSSCGSNGLCNGSGGCQSYKAGTPCGDGESCSGTTHQLADGCDGAGACKPGGSMSCAPFKCNGATCFTTCGSSADCVEPNLCIVGSCGQKSNGASCSAAAECASGFCEQGVCCGSTCFGPCRSCALPGSPGTCANVPAGVADPWAICKDMGAKTCGFTGKCDGAGMCARYAAGTQCKPPSCPAGSTTLTPPSTCDGEGRCADASPQSCAPYRCDGVGACRSGCSEDGQCAPPATCTKGSCGKKGLGQACGGAGECDSNHCVNGVCCGVASCGKCESCAVSGSEGACKPIPAGGSDTSGSCTDAGASGCGTNGKCNGAGACQLYPPGIGCGSDVCDEDGSTLMAKQCDGAGSCKASKKADCCPYACMGDPSGPAACATACTLGGGCACGTTCVGGLCLSAPEIPLDLPAEAPADAPVDAGVDGPDDAPVDAPADAPVDAPDEFPEDAPDDAPTE